MTVFELLGFALIAAIEHTASNGFVFRRRAPLYNHLIVAASMTFARGLTNMSLQYLNYPSQVIFKSLKLIVVLMGSVFIYQKR
jgi:solute carrier family 35 (adenosine 3'-phospho 5'-phosphosulfate transporter), member B3